MQVQEKRQNMGERVVLHATVKHTATIIFLHGLGDSGYGWATAIGTLRSPFVKLICPTAPTMPVTLNGGFRMPSWFDLRSLDPSSPEDEDGIRKAAGTIHSIIAEEVAAGIPTSRIVLGGFSQGGALAMFSALTFPEPLAGIIALSAWLPLHQRFPAEAIGNRNTPLIQCHGDIDPIVPYRWGQITASLLKQFMSNTEFKTYRGMMHTFSQEEMRDLQVFIDKVLPKP
ncbi:acyl-protein thioesterase 1 isoform X3 [Pseudomyrmex gracilis]|uniref:acyl-protein thioesterase 1 isoform X3 n=1 Tax=Pseudomyrmex gracilis TaxID=219809 RepID=UPI000995CE2A|nr:acyl-protein thioesterase 1 isoform X3 [Pseudomyrmex gracilis]